MPIFNFTAEYSVEHQALDNQHIGLFDLMNKIYDLNKAKAAKEDVLMAFQSLAVKTREHFSEEERLMLAADFDGDEVSRHVAAHQNLLARMQRIIDDYSKPRGTLPMDTMQFFTQWLSSHILKTDKKYVQSLKNAKL